MQQPHFFIPIFTCGQELNLNSQKNSIEIYNMFTIK